MCYVFSLLLSLYYFRRIWINGFEDDVPRWMRSIAYIGCIFFIFMSVYMLIISL